MFYVLMFYAFLSFFKRQKRTAAFSFSHEPMAGPSSSAIDFQGSDIDRYSDVDIDVEFDDESNYDHIHEGYDIHDPDIVRTLTFISASV